MPPELTRKTALITGAIGRALVRFFTEADYRIIATDIGEKPLDLGCTAYIYTDRAQYAEWSAASSGKTTVRTVQKRSSTAQAI